MGVEKKKPSVHCRKPYNDNPQPDFNHTHTHTHGGGAGSGTRISCTNYGSSWYRRWHGAWDSQVPLIPTVHHYFRYPKPQSRASWYKTCLCTHTVPGTPSVIGLVKDNTDTVLITHCECCCGFRPQYPRALLVTRKRIVSGSGTPSITTTATIKNVAVKEPV